MSDDYLYCSAEVRERIWGMFPGQGDTAYRQLTAYLVNTPSVDVDRGVARVPHATWKAIGGESPSTVALPAYAAHVGTIYDDHVWRAVGHPDNRVAGIGLDWLADLSRLRFAAISSDMRNTWLHVETGERYRSTSSVEPARCAAQRRIRCYHARQDDEQFVPRAANLERAKALVADDEVQQRLLAACCLRKPKYDPRDTSMHVYDLAWSFLRKDVRRALMPDYVELDLRAAHLAIFERICLSLRIDTPILTELLGSENVWPTAITQIQEAHSRGECTYGLAKLSAEVRAEYAQASTVLPTKDGMKKAVYATIYGGARSTVLARLTEEMPLPTAVAVYCSPLFKEITKAYEELAKIVKRRKFLNDAFKEKVQLGGSLDLNSVVHLVASSYELALLEPAYAVAEKRSDSIIALNQFDGLAIDGSEEFTALLQSKVAAKAKALKVRTALVTK